MKLSKFFSVLLLIALCTMLFIGCVTAPEEDTVPTPPPDTNTTTTPNDPVVKPDGTKVEIKTASRIHILNSQTLQNEYIATSGNTWGIITLTNCRYSITDGMIKISGSIGRSYATVETSVQNVLIVY